MEGEKNAPPPCSGLQSTSDGGAATGECSGPREASGGEAEPDTTGWLRPGRSSGGATAEEWVAPVVEGGRGVRDSTPPSEDVSGAGRGAHSGGNLSLRE